ncbi:MAG: SDR family oxidoreductase [Betaproteobacteria bacterium]|jgi:NADP-dependent 3-hydroxy acid dehydrogenase YdfG|nr:SDR family oxidoreductase [Betaproteobacteria bacterium]
MDLKGKAALITGATSGIGLAVAESLAKAGVRLVISGRRAELLAGHAKRLPDCVAIPGEISDAAFANDLFARAVAQTGGLDIVVNNAGRVATGPIDEIDIDTVCAMVRVNVEAAFRVAHLAVKHFRGRGSGHLINTGSVLGTKVRAQIGAYAGTKHAVEALSEALRLELAGSGIRITTVEPGLVRTDLHRDIAKKEGVLPDVAEPLTPADVARCVLFALDQPPHVNLPRIMLLPRDQAI